MRCRRCGGAEPLAVAATVLDNLRVEGLRAVARSDAMLANGRLDEAKRATVDAEALAFRARGAADVVEALIRARKAGAPESEKP